MNPIPTAAWKEPSGPKMMSGARMLSTRGVVDGIITEKSHIQVTLVLVSLEETASLARMVFKPRTYRYLVLRTGRPEQHARLKIKGEDLPRMTENLIKCLHPRKYQPVSEDGKQDWLAKQIQGMDEPTFTPIMVYLDSGVRSSIYNCRQFLANS